MKADGLPASAPRSRGHSIQFWVTVLPLVYALSIGPFGKICAHTNNLGGLGDLIGFVYYPLIYCMGEHGGSPPGRFLLWYVHDFWKCPVPNLKGLG